MCKLFVFLMKYNNNVVRNERHQNNFLSDRRTFLHYFNVYTIQIITRHLSFSHQLMIARGTISDFIKTT